MPFPTFPDDLEKTALAAVEKSTGVEIDLGDTLTKLKTAFGKIDAAAFAVPEKVATVKELTGFENALAGEKTKITTFSKSLTDCTKEVYAKAQQLKKDKAKPAAIKHVDNMVTAARAFAETMAGLAREADELVKKARLLFGAAKEGNGEAAPVAPQADKALVQGLTQVKGKPGQFALAIGSKGAYLVAGPRLASDALKQAKADTGGGKFLRGDCEWSEEKKAYVFGLGKKPPGGLAKKIRKAILDQTLKKLQVKVLVRGPDGPEIDADTDADTLGEVDLEEAPEISAPPPPSQDGVAFANRMQSLSPAYIMAIQASPTSRAELDNLSGLATTAAKAGDYATALTRLDAYEAEIKKTLATAAQRAAAPAPGPAGGAKSIPNVIFQQSRLLWEGARKRMLAELQAAEEKILAHCKAINDDPNGQVIYDLADVEAKSKKLYTLLERLDERLIDKLDEALNAKTPELRAEKHQEAKGIIDEYEREVNKNDTLAAMQASQVAQTNLREMMLAVLNGMKSKM
jgi:hypothetical protein